MPKHLLIILFAFFYFATHAQTEKDRILMSGKISVSEKNDPGEINIFNLTTGQYTFTDEYGNFKIYVKKDDELVFSSVFYQQFTVEVTDALLEEKELKINLREGATQLEEVVIRPELTGDISLDIKKLRTEKTPLDSIDIGEALYGYDIEFSADRFTTVDNDAIDKGYLQDGINFANMFRAIVEANRSRIPEVKFEEQVGQLREDAFFQKYLGIPSEQIDDFIDYVQAKGLSTNRLRKQNDLKLIDYLIDESKKFKEDRLKETN